MCELFVAAAQEGVNPYTRSNLASRNNASFMSLPVAVEYEALTKLVGGVPWESGQKVEKCDEVPLERMHCLAPGEPAVSAWLYTTE